MNILIVTEYYTSKTNMTVKAYADALKMLGHKVKILTYFSESSTDDIIYMPVFSFFEYHYFTSLSLYDKFQKLLLIVLGIPLTSVFIKLKIKYIYNSINRDNFIPDLIFQFTGGAYDYEMFKLCKKLSYHFNSKYYIHLFDPIPGLKEWGERDIIIKSTIKLLKPYLQSANMVSSVSDAMTFYFKRIFNLSSSKTKTLYMPINYKPLDLSKEASIFSFLYLGTIYGKRDPSCLFTSFKKLAEDGISFNFVLAGTKLNFKEITQKYPSLEKHLKIIDWTDDPDDLIAKSSALIDINADIEGDVFISSKLMRYLGFNKPILVIANKNSASYDFASKFQGTVLTSNNFDDIYSSLNHVLKTDFSTIDRKYELTKYKAINLVSGHLRD